MRVNVFNSMNDSVVRVLAAYAALEKNKKTTVPMDLSESIKAPKRRFIPAKKKVKCGKIIKLEAWIDDIHVTKKRFVKKQTKLQRMSAMVKR